MTGMTAVEVAKRLGRARDWVQDQKAHPVFKARVESYLAEQLNNVKTYGYGNQGKRLATLDATLRELDQRRQQHGLTTTVTKYDRDGNVLEEREVIEKDLLAEQRAYARALAEELGQLPRAGDVNGGNVVLIREMNVTIER
jgi:hypothetical protein